MSCSALEQRARRRARSLGWKIEKSRRRINFTDRDQGGYAIIDMKNHHLLWGKNFDLTLSDVLSLTGAD